MSRFGDGDGEENFNNEWALWENRAHLALRGRRGKAALRELREALEALPEERLISGALCTVGLRSKLETLPEKVPGKVWDAATTRYVEGVVENPERIDIEELVARNEPEGVCAMGAFAWYRKVKAGMDPDEAFAALPVLPDTDYDSGAETARHGRDELGLAYSLAWTIAEQNDSEYGFGDLTPEQRYIAFIGWIDKELATPTPAKPAPRPKRGRRAQRVPAAPAGSAVLGL